MQPVHVLLVEDDPSTVFTTRRFLRRTREVSAITVAVDGRDALDQLKSGALGTGRVVILTDLGMPRMNGLELVAAIRDEPPLRDLPVIVLTASTDDTDRQAALSMHVDGYFTKAPSGLHLEKTLAWLRDYCTSPAPASGV